MQNDRICRSFCVSSHSKPNSYATRCPECGSFVKKDAKSCPRCGAGLSAIPFTEPKEEAESPHQDTDDYPRLVQEFTAYYNKYQQLRQKAMQQPQKFDKQLKRYLKIRHATPTPPDTPWLGRFRIYRDYRCVFRVSFKKECILVEWPSQKKNHPDHSDEREPDTDAQTLLRLLCSDLHVSDYEESQLSYTSDARINDLLSTDTDSEIFLSSLILSITATAIIALAWHHGKLGLGTAYFLSLGTYIVLPPIIRLFLSNSTK